MYCLAAGSHSAAETWYPGTLAGPHTQLKMVYIVRSFIVIFGHHIAIQAADAQSPKPSSTPPARACSAYHMGSCKGVYSERAAWAAVTV